MVLSLVVVDFVDGLSGVDDRRLNCLLLNNGLDVLVDICKIWLVHHPNSMQHHWITYGGGRARLPQL